MGLSSIYLFKALFIPDIPLKEVTLLKDRYEKVLIAETQSDFTEDKFISKIKELNLKQEETVNLDGFVMLSYRGTYDLAVYEKLFDPLKGAVEYVIQNPNKGIVFIGKLTSFDELKDQLKRCQLH